MYDVSFDLSSEGRRTEWLDLVVQTDDALNPGVCLDMLDKPIMLPPSWDRTINTLRCYVISR
eukprot:2068668-Alexandrium_andersonii.AAC.1